MKLETKFNPQAIIDAVPEENRKEVDHIYYVFCTELDADKARKDLQDTINALQYLLDNSKF